MKKKTLVLGASLNPARYSNLSIERLVRKNIATEAVGLKEGTVNGVTINSEMIDFEGIDTITLYLNAKRQATFYAYIIALQPKRVIFNKGTKTPALSDLLRKNNIDFQNACTLVMLSKKQY